MAINLLFDKVVIANDVGPSTSCTPEQFVSIPLHKRVQMMLEHRIEFYFGPQKLDGRQALQNFRQWAASRIAPALFSVATILQQ